PQRFHGLTRLIDRGEQHHAHRDSPYRRVTLVSRMVPGPSRASACARVRMPALSRSATSDRKLCTLSMSPALPFRFSLCLSELAKPPFSTPASRSASTCACSSVACCAADLTVIATLPPVLRLPSLAMRLSVSAPL